MLARLEESGTKNEMKNTYTNPRGDKEILG
jgi:hypothetical protein